MTPSFDKVRQLLKMLPGMGHRSAERIALHLLVERPGKLTPLLESLQAAAAAVRRCTRCGSLAEAELCPVCLDPKREPASICVVELVPDLMAIERSAAYRGSYHVLHGRLSPINGVGPDQLNLASFEQRLKDEPITEVVLALGNDIEGFVPVSQLNPEGTVTNPADFAWETMNLVMRVLEVDPIHRRIVLAVTSVPEEQPPKPAEPSKVHSSEDELGL